jgi:hypothetical protein
MTPGHEWTYMTTCGSVDQCRPGTVSRRSQDVALVWKGSFATEPSAQVAASSRLNQHDRLTAITRASWSGPSSSLDLA